MSCRYVLGCQTLADFICVFCHNHCTHCRVVSYISQFGGASLQHSHADKIHFAQHPRTRNSNPFAVCAPGTGGSGCTTCPMGTWSGGGSSSDPQAACTPCATGFTTWDVGKGTAEACKCRCNGF